MNEEKLIWGAGFIDDDLVSEAIDYKPRRIRLAPWACTAAAAVVLVTAFVVFARFGGNSTVLPPDSSGIGTSTGLPEYTAGTGNWSVPNDSYGETVEKNSSQISDPTVSTSDDSTFAPPEEDFPFPGMELTGETLTVGNLPANAKEMSTNAFFCCDEDGEIYYTNLADGGYLYHLNDGKPEKLADLPAIWITAVGDDIFFISPKGTITSQIGDSGPTGTVYRYSKTEKRSEVYLDEDNITCLHATADGLYYGTREQRVYESGKGTSVAAEYFRGFQSNVSEKQPMNYWLETCGYHLGYSEERNTFFMTNGRVSADIAADDTLLFMNGCIVDKKNYAFFRKTFRILNLQTGGMRVYTVDDFSSLLGGANSEISGYTVLDGCAYLCFDRSFIIKIDENGALSSLSCGDQSLSFRQMYTDGSDLYGFTGSDIVKIIFTDDNRFSVLKLGAT